MLGVAGLHLGVGAVAAGEPLQQRCAREPPLLPERPPWQIAGKGAGKYGLERQPQQRSCLLQREHLVVARALHDLDAAHRELIRARREVVRACREVVRACRELIRARRELASARRELVGDQLADEMLLAATGGVDQPVEGGSLLARKPHEQRDTVLGHPRDDSSLLSVDIRPPVKRIDGERRGAQSTQAPGRGGRRSPSSPLADNQPIEQPALPDRSQSPSTEPPGLLARAADRIAPTGNPARVVYGLLVVGALLAAESGLQESHLDTVLSVLIAVAVYWLAHAYADMLGERLALQQRLSASALVRALSKESAILRGAAPPLLVLALAWAAGSSQQTAVTAALWSVVASVIALELIAGLRSHATPGELALDVCVGTTMGVAVVALKLVLH